MVWVVIVAAGSGARFGGAKQYARLRGRRVIDWAIESARSVGDGIVLVTAQEPGGDAEAAADVIVGGGATRSDSVRCGLAAVPDDAEIVVVHDAARPLASPALFEAVVAAVRAGADGAVPGVPAVDTIKRVGPDGVVLETLDRSALVAVQTPQGFRAESLRAAHASGLDATDDAALVEQWGGRVVVVPGEEQNRKITVPSDLDRLESQA